MTTPLFRPATRLLSALACCLLLPAPLVHAQQICGTTERLQQEALAHPQRAAQREALELFTQEWLAENGTAAAHNVITIPVVFHVLWRNAEENVSDARLLAQLQQLNADFARQNIDAGNTPATFAGVAADTEIRFCLAQRDPEGNATTGIVRRQTTLTDLDYGSNDVFQTALGGSDGWPRASYLNIWVCDLQLGLFGFAQFPGGPAATDGIVLQHAVVGGFAEPGTLQGYAYGRTATHEVGHWLNLVHIWGDVTCGDDFVNDTPVHDDANYGCPTHPHLSACSGNPAEMFMNYMDYANDDCKNLFTEGQAARMQATLASSVSDRDQLAGSPGCLPPDGGSSCATPQGLMTSAVDNTTATVQWDAVSGATSYDVRYRPLGTEAWTTVNSTATTLPITGLVDATTYDWQVRANCTGGTSAYSHILLFATGTTDADGDGRPAGIDCDDSDPATYPGAPELCDGVDNDCDGQVDEGLVGGTILLAPADGVSAGGANVQVTFGGTTLFSGNVDIAFDPEYGTTLGQVDLCAPVGCLEVLVQETGTALDPVGYFMPLDQQEDPIAFDLTSGTPVTIPMVAMAEVCGDGIDNDCDGEVDEDILWYTDADGDGFGDPSTGLPSCAPLPGRVAVAGDCDDQSASVSPGAAETCDGIDNDCDGQVDEDFLWYADADGDGFGDPATAQPGCPPPGGVTNDLDCNDADPAITAIGQPCDDGDPGTHSDTVNSSCLCVGIPVNNCPPGEIPDCNGNCAPADWIADAWCDKGLWYSEYNGHFIDFHCALYNFDGGDCDLPEWSGPEWTDADGDGYPVNMDCDDTDPTIRLAGEECDDGDPETWFDVRQADCTCAGIPVDTCPEGEMMDCNGNCAPAYLVGSGDCEEGMLWHGVPISFNCAEFGFEGGDCTDADGDGFAASVDCDDNDPNITLPFEPCDDGDPDTFNDRIGLDCTCHGVPAGSPCPYYDEIQDCNGNCVPASWLGDGSCDDGSFEWEGVPIFLNCPELNYDGGDCGNGCTAEVCDGQDNDCDGAVDEDFQWYVDADGDGFGDEATAAVFCEPPVGLVQLGGDCDDADDTVYPDAPCDDGDAATVNDAWSSDCSCLGVPAGLLVSSAVWLDGAYLPATGGMRADLRSLPGFPLTQPYGAWGHNGTEAIDPALLAVEGGNAVVDWVLLELRAPQAPGVAAASRAALLLSNGLVVEVDGSSPVHFPDAAPGPYHLVLRHRNHLGVMSAEAFLLDHTAVLIDWRDAAMATAGPDARRTVSGAFPALTLWSGDVNADGTVKYVGTDNDRDLVLSTIGGVVPTNSVSGYLPEDVNLDGVVRYTGADNDRDLILKTVGGVVPTNVRPDNLP